MIFKAKNGELRIYEGHATPYYLKVLFTNADLSFPLNRGKSEELLNMDRGNFDANASYSLGSDDPVVNPLPVRFSMRMDDTVYTHKLARILSGSTKLTGATALPAVINPTTTKGTTWLPSGVTQYKTKAFASTGKVAYNIEMSWDGSTDFIYKLSEVYFPPDQQNITEGEDAIRIDMNGLWYGSGGTVPTFTSGKPM